MPALPGVTALAGLPRPPVAHAGEEALYVLVPAVVLAVLVALNRRRASREGGQVAGHEEEDRQDTRGAGESETGEHRPDGR